MQNIDLKAAKKPPQIFYCGFATRGNNSQITNRELIHC